MITMVKNISILIAVLISIGCFASNTIKAQDRHEISKHETTYATFGKKKNRAYNIEKAAEKFLSLVVLPGESISFNDIVGERTKARGYRPAPVIMSGRIFDDFGGGICQVASTLHAAALFAGMGIEERHAHSRISSYIKPGLDATIDWGKKDLVLLNQFSYPIRIVAAVENTNRKHKKKLTFTIFSDYNNHKVGYETFHKVMSQYKTVKIVDKTLKPGEVVVEQKGTPKVYAVVYREVRNIENYSDPIQDTIIVKEKFQSMYKSADKIIRVGVKK